MSTPRSVTFAFTAVNQSSPALQVKAGQKLVFGTRGGNATIALQYLSEDGTTWVAVRLPNTATACEFATTTIGSVTLDVAPGQYRMTATAWTSNKTGFLWVNE